MLHVHVTCFNLIDRDGSGKITTSELRETLLSMGQSLTLEEIDAAMTVFDRNGSGDITKHEFMQTLEMMKTFE